MQKDLNRLVEKPTEEPRLEPSKTPPAIRAKTGLERQRASKIDSEELTVKSSDGLFTFIVRVVKT